MTACAVLGFVALLGLPQAPDRPLPPGTEVRFQAQTLDGQAVRSDSLRGRPTLLALWGTWSPQSARSLEVVRGMQEKFGKRGLRVVALASWDTKENVSAFKGENPQLKFEFWWDPAARDTSGSIAVKTFKTRRFPTFYVLDRNARVVQGFVGFKPKDTANLEAAIEGALPPG